MSFERSFPGDKLAIVKESHRLFKEKLSKDIVNGDVFPAIRKGELHFYHGGGFLFRFDGASFKRNRAYDGGKADYVSEKTYGKCFIECYNEFKRINSTRFGGTTAGPLERQFLEKLYSYTYKNKIFPKVCVLDIEVRVNEGNGKNATWCCSIRRKMRLCL